MTAVPPKVAKLTLEWPMALPSMSNARLHWAAKARRTKAQRVSAGLALRANGVGWRLTPLEPGGHLIVWLDRQAPRRLDDDNLRGAFKAVRDEVAAFFHVPDNYPSLSWCYRQSKGPATVRIEFEALTAAQVKAIRERIEDNAAAVLRLADLAGLLP
jgi:hypothetical protein